MTAEYTSMGETCPWFGQDRVNFHQNPGRDTAGGWGLTPPGQTEPGIPYHVPSRWVPVEGGGRRGGNSLAAREGAALVLFGRAGLWGRAVRCCVFPLSVSLLLLFPLFAVVLNCSYPDPPVSASFFPFSSAPRWGEGRARDAFVAGGNRNQNINLAPRCGAGITAGLSSGC